jgi:arabinan endo-1,5-alpha-L-arabinosidase
MQMADGTPVENCADPTVIRGQQSGDTSWYMYCTADALHDQDKDTLGSWNYHLIPIFRSQDLVHWTHMGDALASRPSWAEAWSNVWAPEIAYFNGKYYLYFAVTDTKYAISGERLCADDSAIGVATSTSPTGPFTNAGQPVVYPRRSGSGCSFHLTIDPDVVVDGAGQEWIYYGNFNGGIEVRRLSADGLASDAASATDVVITDRAEAPEVVYRGGYYYLFHSVSDCCKGPMSGYAVYVGRAATPTGPFVDKDALSLLASRTGGTPVLSFTGNRWVGPGHNTVFADLAGQDWTIYHAIEFDEPYFAGSVGYTKRPAMLDPITWKDGWPSTRGGWWISTCRQPAPVAQSGGTPGYFATYREDDRPGEAIPEASDEFDGGSLGPQWSWIREPSPAGWELSGGLLRFDTQGGDLWEDRNDASVLVEPAPAGDLLVDVRVRHTMPASGCCQNYTQAGVVIYADDDNYVKLSHVSIWSTRQTEFAKEVGPVPSGYPRFGGTRVGTPDEWTWLRIVRRAVFGGEIYTAYSSRDGVGWTRGGSWRHALGSSSKIGLVSMSGSGFTAYFDFVRSYRLAPVTCSDPALTDPCDDDGDGIGDRCDPDDDGDGRSDIEDCAPSDATQGRPDEADSLTLAGPPSYTLSWRPIPIADGYDVTRGPLSGLAWGDFGVCLSNDQAATSLDDPGLPASGEGFTYLVRGVDSGCGGGGTYGSSGSGSERSNTNPSTCP